jgi:methanogenic corrinoid protein MtbC1
MTATRTSLYQPINLDREYLAGKMLDRYTELYPKPWNNFSASRKTRIRDEFISTIQCLQESLATGSPAFLVDYTCRDQARFSTRYFPGGFVESYLKILAEIIPREMPPDYREKAGAILHEAIAAVKTCPEGICAGSVAKTRLTPRARSFLKALLVGDHTRAETVVDEALASGIPVRDIYLTIFQPALRETGRLWQENEASVAQEHYVTGIIRQIMVRLHERIVPEGRDRRKGKTVIAACVGEELHEIGIRMVSDFFEMDGWDVYYTGGNTPVKCIIDAAKKRKADLIALSVTMPSRLPEVQYLVRSLRADPATAGTKIIVGGYPFVILPDLWSQVGADAGATSADEAVAAANRLMEG